MDKILLVTALLNDGIVMFDESFARDRQIYLTHLADALVRPGKQRGFAAVDRGLAALYLAESLISARSLECLRDLYRRMRPHARVPAGRRLTRTAMGGSGGVIVPASAGIRRSCQ